MGTKIEWADIQGYSGYKISNTGKVLSLKYKTPRIMKTMKSSSGGHLYVFLYKDGKMKKEWVHRLVLCQFYRFPRFFEESRHLDGNSENNNIKNLTWGTRTQNQRDRFKHGTHLLGERSPFAKLNVQKVKLIRFLKGKKSTRELAKIFNVSHTTIIAAQNGHHWRHI